MLDLDAIKYRLAAATPGPWEPAELQGQSQRNSFFSVAVVGRREVRAGIPCQAQPDKCDADLIAHAPQDLAALVAEVERLRTLIIAHRDGCNCDETQSETPPQQCDACFALYEAVENA